MQHAMDGDRLAADFQAHRPRLVRIAYRMLGSLAEAEDVVQEAWLRLAGVDEAPRDLGAWLTTVVGRLCLDLLRSARARREVYVGPWLPEPLVTTPAPGPAERVEADESLRLALLVVLERLTPEQRVAFVLHDVLGLPFAEVAEVLGTTAASARQHAARARRAVDRARPAPVVPVARQQEVVAAFVAATAGGDLAALVKVLAPDVVLTSDSGGRVRAARRPVVGADAVARLLIGLVTQGTAAGGDAAAVTRTPGSSGTAVAPVVLAGPGGRFSVVPVLVNGEAGHVVRLDRADGSVDLSVLVPHVDETGRVAAVGVIRNPEKLRSLPAWAQSPVPAAPVPSARAHTTTSRSRSGAARSAKPR